MAQDHRFQLSMNMSRRRLQPSCNLMLSAGAVYLAAANGVMRGDTTFLNNSAIFSGGEQVLQIPTREKASVITEQGQSSDGSSFFFS